MHVLPSDERPQGQVISANVLLELFKQSKRKYIIKTNKIKM
jgi:hypothetical protein